MLLKLLLCLAEMHCHSAAAARTHVRQLLSRSGLLLSAWQRHSAAAVSICRLLAALVTAASGMLCGAQHYDAVGHLQCKM